MNDKNDKKASRKVGTKETHTCADGTTFTCQGGTLGCADNSSTYCKAKWCLNKDENPCLEYGPACPKLNNGSCECMGMENTDTGQDTCQNCLKFSGTTLEECTQQHGGSSGGGNSGGNTGGGNSGGSSGGGNSVGNSVGGGSSGGGSSGGGNSVGGGSSGGGNSGGGNSGGSGGGGNSGGSDHKTLMWILVGVIVVIIIILLVILLATMKQNKNVSKSFSSKGRRKR